jgi:hypothetical protein
MMMDHYSHATRRIMARLCTVQSCSPSAPTSVSPQAAHGNSPCPHLAYPYKEKTKEKKKRRKRSYSPPTTLPALLPLPNLTPSPFPVPGSSSFGPILRPTSVVRRKSKIGRAHRSSANMSQILKRFFPLPVSLRTSAHRIFCCAFYRGQFLNRYSRVCTLPGHHPHFVVARLLDH